MKIADVQKRPTARTVVFVENPKLAEQLTYAEAQLSRAQGRSDTPTSKLDQFEDELEELRNQARAQAIAFRVQALPRGDFDDLKLEHPPTKAQRDAAKKEQRNAGLEPQPLQWNPDTFPPALLSASIITPHADDLSDDDPPIERFIEPMTVDEATEFYNGERFSSGEMARLLMAAMAANGAGSVVELKGS